MQSGFSNQPPNGGLISLAYCIGHALADNGKRDQLGLGQKTKTKESKGQASKSNDNKNHCKEDIELR